MLEALITVWVIGMIATLFATGYISTRYNMPVKHLTMLVCLPIWPLFLIMALGSVTAKPKKKVIGRR